MYRLKERKKIMKNSRKAILVTTFAVLALMTASCANDVKEAADNSTTAVTTEAAGNSAAESTSVQSEDAPEAETTEKAETTAEESVFPFDLVTYEDKVVTFTKVPETVIAANANAGDELMALGLKDKIIYTCYTNSKINPEWRDEYEALPVLAEKAATLEQFLDVSPDFIYGRSSAFSEKNGTQHDTLQKYGIASLSSIEGYKLGADVEDVYQDFYNLGKIFQIEDKAEEVVSGIKSRVDEAESKVKDAEPVRVFVFDYLAEDGPYTCGNNFAAKLISHAGGKNIFEDMEKTWSTVSWEKVIELDPEVIVINDYGSVSLEEKISQLKDDPALADISAIKNDRIISVGLCEVFASSMLGDTIYKFAEAFHPECFAE